MTIEKKREIDGLARELSRARRKHESLGMMTIPDDPSDADTLAASYAIACREVIEADRNLRAALESP